MKKLFFITSIMGLMLGSCDSGNKPKGGDEGADSLKEKKAAAKPKDENPYQLMMNHYNELSPEQYRATKRVWLTVADAQELVEAADKNKIGEIDLIPVAYDKKTGAEYAKKMGLKIEDVIDKPTLIFALTVGGGGTQPMPTPVKGGTFCPPPQPCDSITQLIAKMTPGMVTMTGMVKYYDSIKTDNYRDTKRMWMTVKDFKTAIDAANKAKVNEISFFFAAFDKAATAAYVKTHKGTKETDIQNRMTVIVVSPGATTVNGGHAHFVPFISSVLFCPPPDACVKSPTPPSPGTPPRA